MSASLLTATLTVVGSVVVYALSQIVLKFIIELIHEQKKVIGEIADTLVFYANIYTNPGTPPKEIMDEASKRLRTLATLLQSRTHLIPWYGVFGNLHIVPSIENVSKASSELIGLSNSIHQKPQEREEGGYLPLDNSHRADKIAELLNLRIRL